MNGEILTQTLSGEKMQYLGMKQTEVRAELVSDSGKKAVSVMALRAIPQLSYSESLKGEVRFSGKLHFIALVMMDDESMELLNADSDFSDRLDNPAIAPVTKCSFQYDIQDVSVTSFTEHRVNVSATLGVKVYAENTVECKCVAENANLICKTEKKACACLSAQATEEVVMEEQFESKGSWNLIHFYDCCAEVTNVSAGNDVVTLEGNLYLSITYSDTEKEVTNNLNQILPFRYEVEAQGCSLIDRATGRVKVLSCKLVNVVDEEKDITQFNLEANLQLCVKCYAEKELDLTVDAFCPECKVKTTATGAELSCLRDSVRRTEKLEGTARITENMKEIYRVVALCGTDVCITAISRDGRDVRVDGLVRTNAIYDDSEGKKNALFAEIPFSAHLGVDFTDGFVVADAVVTEIYARSRNGKDVDIYLTLVIQADLYENQAIMCISDVELSDESLELFPVSIYFADEGETLWDACKKLNCRPEIIKVQNRDVDDVIRERRNLVLFRE